MFHLDDTFSSRLQWRAIALVLRVPPSGITPSGQPSATHFNPANWVGLMEFEFATPPVSVLAGYWTSHWVNSRGPLVYWAQREAVCAASVSARSAGRSFSIHCRGDWLSRSGCGVRGAYPEQRGPRVSARDQVPPET